MPVDKQYVQVDFTGGLDTKTDQRVVIPGNLTSLQNGVYTKTGSIRKRNGNTALNRTVYGTGATLPVAMSVAKTEDDTPIVFGERTLFAQSSLTSDTWLNQDEVSEATTLNSPVTHSETMMRDSDIAVNTFGNLTIVAYSVLAPTSTTIGTIYVSVYDTTTNVVVHDFLLSTGAIQATCVCPRVVVCGGAVIVMYQDAGTGQIFARQASAGNLTVWGVQVQLTVDCINLASDIGFDAATDGTNFYIVYYTNTGQFRVRSYDVNYVQIAQTDSAIVASPLGYAIQVNAANDRVWAGFTYGVAGVTSVSFRVFQMNLAPVGVLFTAFTTGPPIVGVGTRGLGVSQIGNGTTACIFGNVVGYDVIPPAAALTTAQVPFHLVITQTGVAVGPTRRINANVQFVSKAIQYNSHTYAFIYSYFDRSIFLMDLQSHDTTGLLTVARPVASSAIGIAPTTGVRALGALASAPAFTQLGAGKYITSNPLQTQDALDRSAIYVTTIDFTSVQRRLTENVNGLLYMTGGIPSYYDGKTVGEIGFLQRPKVTVASPVAGGALPNGAHSYRVVYEYYDARGNRHESAPSDIVTVTTAGANNTVSLTITSCALTTRQDAGNNFFPSIYVVVYRQPAGGSNYQRLTETIIPAANNSSPLVLYLTITDSGAVTDLVLSTRPYLYTTGGIQENQALPSCTLLTQSKDRIVFAGSDVGSRVFISQPIVELDAVGFNLANNFLVEDSSDLTAIASMDDKLLLFKEDQTYVVYGDGQDRTGLGATYTLPQPISSDTGCSEPRSLVETEMGVFFRSKIGFYLLDRGLSMQYIGAPVEDIANTYTRTTSAVRHKKLTHVLFTVTDSAGEFGTLGRVLVYDFFHQKWSVFLFRDTVANINGVEIQGATMSGDNYFWITRNTDAGLGGVPYIENPTGYTDNGAFVELSMETAWLKFSGIMGFQRVRRISMIGEFFSAHNLEMSLAHNYISTYSQTDTHVYSTLGFASEQWTTYVVQQKCESVRLKIRDVQSPDGIGTGRSYSISGLGLEVGAKKGIFKLPIAQGG